MAVCVVGVAAGLFVFAPDSFSRHPLNDWLLFAPVPGLVVFAASRIDIFKDRPWLLLPFGLLALLIAVTTVMMTHNILFATAILARTPKSASNVPLPTDEADDQLSLEPWQSSFARTTRTA